LLGDKLQGVYLIGLVFRASFKVRTDRFFVFMPVASKGKIYQCAVYARASRYLKRKELRRSLGSRGERTQLRCRATCFPKISGGWKELQNPPTAKPVNLSFSIITDIKRRGAIGGL